MIECPDRAEIEELIAGRLPPDRLAVLERHLDDCRRCRRQLDNVCGIGTVLPDGPVPECRRPPSDGLKRVLEELHAAPLPSVALQVGQGEVRHREALPFLQATDRPGFLGRLGTYDIRREIGRGGMGVVFEGFDPALRRTVAVKILSPLVATDETRGRFLREAQAAAALEHEHIVTIHAVDQVHGVPFLVMQYVAGESLAERLAREGRLPFAEVLRIGAQVARGLAAAHAKGLIHRDIKPANILLEAGAGRAKIADFGLAKAVGDGSLTVAGTVAGTPEFMSPEQAMGGLRGEVVDARSDLFSLGVLLHTLCSGASPFRAESPLLTLERVRRDQPASLKHVDPTLPDWFCAVVERLLKKDPADRISSAAELADILEQTRAAPTLVIQTTSPPTVTINPPPRPARRLRWWVAACVAVVGLATAAVLYANRGRSEKEQAGQSPPPRPDTTEQPAPPHSPQTGFVVIGKEQTYRGLSEAVAAARSGEVIEVRGDGPFRTPPVRTGDRRLTIRAAPASHPVFIQEQPTQRAKQPFLTADSHLRLEGLEIHWEMQPSTGWSEVDLLGRSAIVSTAGLTLNHCRVVTGPANICVGASGGEVILTRCHFIADDLGFCVYWRPSSAGLRAEGCQFEGRAGLSVSTMAGAPNPPPAPLHLERNTFTAEKSLNLQVGDGSQQTLQLTARHNLFNSSQHVVLFAVRPLGRMETPRPDIMIALLRALVAWSEEANVYRRGSQFLVSGAAKQGTKMLPAQIDTLAKWQDALKLPPTQSTEGTIRFAERKSTTEPLRLLAVDDRIDSLPDAGASADTIGPGAAYHASGK